MFAFSVVWIVLATMAVVLATSRKFASMEGSGLAEVRSSEENSLRRADAHQTGVVEQWGRVVTGVAVLYCVALLSGFLYISWQNGQQILK